ncbi:MAG: glycosyltransferase, partial [Rectinemataceae bacterium]|nr:glycosyltransferase [Rectinemataceae bacterium]
MKAVRSCLNQTFRNFEVIITDNSLDDRSEKLVGLLNEPLISYHRNDTDIGFFLNTEKARLLSKGKYIKFLMDDDLLRADCLEKMSVVFEQNPNVGIVMAPMAIIDENDKPAHPVFYLVKKMNFLYRYGNRTGLIGRSRIMRDFLTRLYPCCVPSGVMYRRELFDRTGGFDVSAGFAIDVEIAMRFAREYDFYYIHEPLASWRYNSSSATVTLHNSGLDNRIFFALTEKFLQDNLTKSLFPEKEWKRIVKAAYLFASKRSTLAILSGIRMGNWQMIRETTGIVWVSDPFKTHIL